MDRSVQFTFLTVFLLCIGVLVFKTFQGPPRLPLSIEGPSEGIVNNDLTFNIVNLSENEDDIQWSFGESGKTDSRIANPVYKYTKAGNYEITVRVSDRHPAVKKIRISNPPALPIIIDGPSEALVRKEISFNVRNLKPEEINIEWSFGESGMVDSRVHNPSYKYKKAGTYTVKVNVPDHAEATMVINVKEPSVTYTPPPSNMCPNISQGELQNYFQQLISANSDDIKAQIKRQLISYFANPADERVISDNHNSYTRSPNAVIRLLELGSIKSIRIVSIEKTPSNCISSMQITY